MNKTFRVLIAAALILPQSPLAVCAALLVPVSRGGVSTTAARPFVQAGGRGISPSQRSGLRLSPGGVGVLKLPGSIIPAPLRGAGLPASMPSNAVGQAVDSEVFRAKSSNPRQTEAPEISPTPPHMRSSVSPDGAQYGVAAAPLRERHAWGTAVAAFAPLRGGDGPKLSAGAVEALLGRVMDGAHGKFSASDPGVSIPRGATRRLAASGFLRPGVVGEEALIPEAQGRGPVAAGRAAIRRAEAAVSSFLPMRKDVRRVGSAFALWRTILGPFFKLIYRPRIHGVENVPQTGPALLLPNHVTWVDVFLLGYVVGRPIRFLMHKRHFEDPKMHWFVKAFDPIPIESGKPEAVDLALGQARRALQQGEVVALFPEGTLTSNGNLGKFKRGMETVAQGLDAPVIPVHLDGLWGSYLSRKPGVTFWEAVSKRQAQGVIIRFGAPLKRVTAGAARRAVELLSAESMAERVATFRKPLALSFLETARRFWGKPALADSTGKAVAFGEALTGGVLLAGLLRKDLADEPNVGLLLPPTVGGALANAALSILGKVPVNLNYTAPPSAFDHSVAKAGIKTIVTSRRFLEGLAAKKKLKGEPMYEPNVRMVFLEDLLGGVSKFKRILTYVLLRVLPQSLIRATFLRDAARDFDADAAIIFTSGSTGLPKGVELTQMNVRANVEMLQEVTPFGPGEVLLGVLPFFHSFGFTVTLWLSLLSGLKTVYHTDPFDAETVGKLAQEHKATILLATPTFLRRYREKIPAERFSTLKFVVAGAEKLYPRDAEAFAEKYGVTPLEGYGTTENSPVDSANIPDVIGVRDGVRGVLQPGNRPGSVGLPLPGVAVRIVDSRGVSQPTMKEGRIIIAGPHVMKGYLGEPAKTAEVIKDGWYDTGDIGYRDREGFIYLTGRASRVIKIGGEMVSPELVEEKLQKAAGSDERLFVVASVPDSKMGERLVVFHLPLAGSVRGLLDAVEGLPKLWTPSEDSFYQVESFPVLGTGKLDFGAIKEWAKTRAGKS